MAYYRLYYRRRGHIYRAEEIEAGDDVQAVARARERLADEAAELWCGSRRVKGFEPAAEPPSAPVA